MKKHPENWKSNSATVQSINICACHGYGIQSSWLPQAETNILLRIFAIDMQIDGLNSISSFVRPLRGEVLLICERGDNPS